MFNTNLRLLINDCKTEMPGSDLVIVNAYNIVQDIIRNPALEGKNIHSSPPLIYIINSAEGKFCCLFCLGFTDTRQPCCQVLSLKEGGNGISCKTGGSTCEDRSKHVYFDGLHPTEAVNVVLAAKAFGSSSPSEVYPFNISKLAQI